MLGLKPGEVFTHRNIANVVHTSDMNILSVLEFAVEQLKIKHIIVCWHYGCSGIRRALAQERGAFLDYWLQPIAMLHRKHQHTFDRIQDETLRFDRLCQGERLEVVAEGNSISAYALERKRKGAPSLAQSAG